jgi:hypothetical protein
MNSLILQTPPSELSITNIKVVNSEFYELFLFLEFLKIVKFVN